MTRRAFTKFCSCAAAVLLLAGCSTAAPTITAPTPSSDGLVLPFPPPPSESVAKPKIEDSTMKWPMAPQRLAEDAPNILVIMIDDIGFGVTDTFGGEVHTPALTALAEQGIRYNAFHTTSICSPDPRRAFDGSEPHAGRRGHHCRARGGIRWIHRHHPEDGSDLSGSTQGVRIQNLRLRQVAQHACERDDRNGSEGSLAHGLRL